jgi:hypothetical protein
MVGGYGLEVTFDIKTIRIFDHINEHKIKVHRVAMVVADNSQVKQFEGYGIVNIMGGIWFDQEYQDGALAPFKLAGMNFDKIEISSE